jgi:hypothetical protein
MKLSLKKSVLTRTLTSLTACVIIAALSGCSDAEADRPDLEETTDASASDPTEYIPASEEGPAQNVPEPRLPVAATEASEEGALKALEYFWEAAEYTRVTGDSGPVELVSSGSCNFCSSFASDWVNAYEAGQWAVSDGEVSYEISEVWQQGGESEPLSFDILFSLSEPDIVLFDETGLVEEEGSGAEGESDWFALTVYDSTAQRWQIEWIGLEELVTWEDK